MSSSLMRSAVMILVCVAAVAPGAEAPAEIVGKVVDAKSKPVPGAAVVFIRQVYDPKTREMAGVEELTRAKSTADGSFRLTLPPASTVPDHLRGAELVRATADGYAYSAVRCDRLKDGVRFVDHVNRRDSEQPTIVLSREAQLTGAVTDEAGQPVEGATVLPPPIRNSVKTDAQGRFTFDKFDPSFAREQFKVAHPDFVEQTVHARERAVAAADKPLQLDVQLERGVLISGRLTEDGTDKPVAGYGVVAAAFREHWTTWADADGRYQVRVPSGFLVLHPIAGPAPGETKPANLYPVPLDRKMNAAAKLRDGAGDFAFRKGCVIAGSLEMPKDAKLPDVLAITVLPAGSGSATRRPFWSDRMELVNADRTFRLERLWPGNWEVRVVARSGEVLGRAEVELGEGEDKDGVRIAVAPPAPKPTLSGRVVGPDGKPVANAAVLATSRGAVNPADDPPDAQASTNGDGRFILERLAVDRKWLITAHDEKKEMVAAQHVVGGAEAFAKEIELVLGPGAEVSGTVVDEQGRPLAGMPVTVSRETKLAGRPLRYNSFSTTETDEQGRYRITGLIVPPDAEGEIVLMVIPSRDRRGARVKSMQSIAARKLDLGSGKKNPDKNFRVRKLEDVLVIEPEVVNEGL